MSIFLKGRVVHSGSTPVAGRAVPDRSWQGVDQTPHLMKTAIASRAKVASKPADPAKCFYNPVACSKLITYGTNTSWAFLDNLAPSKVPRQDTAYKQHIRKGHAGILPDHTTNEIST